MLSAAQVVEPDVLGQLQILLAQGVGRVERGQRLPVLRAADSV